MKTEKEFFFKKDGHEYFYFVTFDVKDLSRREIVESVDHHSHSYFEYDFDFDLKIETLDEDGNDISLNEMNLPAEHLVKIKQDIWDEINENAEDFYNAKYDLC